MHAGTQAVAQRIAHVVLGENLGDVVEALVEEVLLVMVRHPLRQNRAAAAHDAGDALGDQRQVLDQHAGMDGHVIDALLGLLFDHFEHDVGIEVFDALHARDRLVDRHRADGHRRVAQDGFADLVDAAAGREVHHRVGAVVDRGVQLLQLLVDVAGDGRIADVGVDLALRGHANAHRLQLRMVDVGRNDHVADGDLVADQLGRDLLALGDEEHLFGEQALARKVHLRHVGVAGARGFFAALRDPLGARIGRGRAVAAIGSTHNLGNSWLTFDYTV